MNNKPIAYAMFKNGEYYDAIHPDEQAKTVGEYDIPLYTHPVKELTDEEIIAIANGCLVGATAWHNPDLDPIEFARAILRKAQER
jgi:hypothetical protein